MSVANPSAPLARTAPGTPAAPAPTIIVVDDFSLLRRPTFLTVRDPRARVVTTPEAVASARELALVWGYKGYREFPALLDRALAAGTVTIRAAPRPGEPDALPVQVEAGDGPGRAGPIDASVLDVALAIRAAEPTTDLWVSLQRDAGTMLGKSLGLRTPPPNIAVYALQGAAREPTLASATAALRSGDVTFRLLAVLLMIGGTLSSLALARRAGEPLAGLPVGLGAPLVGLVGMVLYWVRAHFRRGYAVLEILFGLATGGTAFVAHRDRPVDWGLVAALAGAIYIVVRGLDNLAKALEGTRHEGWWRRVF